MPTRMTAAEIHELFRAEFPQALTDGAVIDELGDGWARLRRPTSEGDLRPGGTVSGPTLMALADRAMYVAVLAELGPMALAVTTSLHIDFLRKPELGVLVAHAELLKVGKRLAVGRVALYNEGDDDAIAHASVTYSLPPRSRTSGGGR